MIRIFVIIIFKYIYIIKKKLKYVVLLEGTVECKRLIFNITSLMLYLEQPIVKNCIFSYDRTSKICLLR